MVFPSCQTVKITWLDEIAFAFAFLLLNVINKSELEGKWDYSPSSFIAWQSLFTFVIFIFLLLYSKIRNEVKILDKANFILILPVCISHTFVLLTGAAALSALPIPIFLAWSNLCPAILVLVSRRSNNFKSSVILGLASVFLSAILIFIIDSKEVNRLFYLVLLLHIVINVGHSLYIKKVDLQIPNFILVFYINLINFIIIFPYGVYNAIKAPPEPGDFLPCFFSGFNCLAVEIFKFRLKAKNNRILVVQGVAQFLTISASYCLFNDSLDLLVWGLIGTNCLTTAFILNFDDDVNKNNQFILIVPHMTENVYVEKYINCNDMA